MENKMMKLDKLLTIILLLCLVIVFSTPVLAGNKVNINTASQEELCTLKNIGDAYAKRIIEYRTAQKFQKPEDIMEVKGIGPKTYELNKDRIVVKDKKS
ncbi:MAG: helix-hairpin-helix domain-containing protein [Desulfobacteraceae bacterium]|nr:helix-hairpin-helix domain-containing protein [Desulfobacteraceae bacterium]